MTKTLSKAIALILSVLCLFTVGMTALAAPKANYISEATAKQVAFKYAGVSEGSAKHVTVKFDYDDGIACYDVSFTSGMTEYDCEVNAVTGAIRDFDKDLTWYGEVVFWFNRVLAFFGIGKK